MATFAKQTVDIPSCPIKPLATRPTMPHIGPTTRNHHPMTQPTPFQDAEWRRASWHYIGVIRHTHADLHQPLLIIGQSGRLIGHSGLQALADPTPANDAGYGMSA